MGRRTTAGRGIAASAKNQSSYNNNNNTNYFKNKNTTQSNRFGSNPNSHSSNPTIFGSQPNGTSSARPMGKGSSKGAPYSTSNNGNINNNSKNSRNTNDTSNNRNNSSSIKMNGTAWTSTNRTAGNASAKSSFNNNHLQGNNRSEHNSSNNTSGPAKSRSQLGKGQGKGVGSCWNRTNVDVDSQPVRPVLLGAPHPVEPMSGPVKGLSAECSSKSSSANSSQLVDSTAAEALSNERSGKSSAKTTAGTEPTMKNNIPDSANDAATEALSRESSDDSCKENVAKISIADPANDIAREAKPTTAMEKERYLPEEAPPMMYMIPLLQTQGGTPKKTGTFTLASPAADLPMDPQRSPYALPVSRDALNLSALAEWAQGPDQQFNLQVEEKCYVYDPSGHLWSVATDVGSALMPDSVPDHINWYHGQMMVLENLGVEASFAEVDANE